MFWSELAAAAEESSLQKLLCNHDPPLQEVLADPLMFQELRQGNKNLVDFLTKPARLVEMTKSALLPTVDNELPIENQYKLSHMSAEVLTVRNIDDIVNAFVECPEAMAILANSLGKDKLNSVTGIFYDKMVTHILSRHFPNAMTLLKQTNFVENSLSCMEIGAIAFLLQKVDRIPTMSEEINEMKQYLVEQRLIPRLVELFDEKQIPIVHDNAAETFIDILRNLRDVLYTYDDKEDALHDSFLEKETVTDLTNRMLKRDESGVLIPSIVLNVSEMLLALIESNSTGNTPSQILDCERLLIETPVDDDRHEEENRSNEPWRPDGARMVETVVASHAGDILSAVIEDLQSDTPGDNWHCLLNLIVALCDTNHLPTHHLLTAGFKSVDFGKLFDLVWQHPNCTVFHRLLSKIVTFALFSSTGDVSSPLIDYFLNDCKLIWRLSLGIRPICCLRKLSLMSLRAFHIQLARFLQTARVKGSNTDKIDVALKVSTDWPSVEEAFIEFLEWNRPDLQSGSDSSRLSYGFDQAGNSGGLDDFEAFCHFDSVQSCPEIDARVPSFPDSAFSNFSVSRSEAADPVDINLRENDVEEKEFDSICGMKDLENWPNAPKKSADDSSSSLDKSFPLSWPGEDNNEKKEKDDCWDKRLSNGSGDDWVPSSSPEKNDSSADENKDEWADFGSAAEPLQSDTKPTKDDWPGEEKSTDVEWPAAPVVATAPTTASWASFGPNDPAEQSVPGETDA